MTYNEVMAEDSRFLDWDLEIYDKPYQVIKYDGYNNEDYVCFEIKSHYQRVKDYFVPDGDIEVFPCHRVRGNAPSWEIKQSKVKTFKTKWGDTDVRFSCLTTVYRNGDPFFEFGGDEDYAYHKAKSQLVEIWDGPINFHSRWWKDELLNREIRYEGQPAIIKRANSSPFSIWIEPVNDKFSPPSRWDNDSDCGLNREYWDEEYAGGLIVESVLDPSINWFPKN